MGLVRSGSLDLLVDESSGREIVETPQLEDRFEDLKKKYKLFLDDDNNPEEWFLDNIHDVLLPSDINLFLQQTREYEDHTNYNYTGHFISQLIQNSYNAGNNGFELDVNALKPISYLCSDVSGTEERLVRMIIKGRVGDYCGLDAQHSMFTIEKARFFCGWYAEHSTFTIWETKHLCWEGAQHSIFKTHNPEQYKLFRISVPQNKENKLYLLAADGSILKGGEW